MDKLSNHIKPYQFKKGDARTKALSKKANDVQFEKYFKDQTMPVPVKKLKAAAKNKQKAKVKRERKQRLVLYGANRMLSPQDKEFATLIGQGTMSKTKAFIKAYDIVLPPKATEQYRIERARIHSRAMAKTRSQKIARYINNVEEEMDNLFVKSVEVANDILDNGRGEKVKAELAIEFIRQKRGAPTTKVTNDAVQSQIIIMVGEKPAPKVSESNKYFVEGEVVETTPDNANIITDGKPSVDDGLSDITDSTVIS